MDTPEEARDIAPHGLPFDPEAALQHLRAADPPLGAIIAQVGAFVPRWGQMRTPFEALLRSIVYQQLSGRAAETILGRTKALFAPKDHPEPEDLLGASDDRLRSAGLSRSKVLALRDLAAKTLSGIVPTLAELESMSDEAIIEQLVSIRGIGRWTVEMLLIFQLQRPDVLPVHDLGVRKGYARTFGTAILPTPKVLAAHGERWRPYRSVASWYCWRATELP